MHHLGLTPIASRPQRCPGPAANKPQDIGLTFGELGKCDYRHSIETVSG